MKICLFLTLALLAACGADGAPERPAAGLTVEGEARLGVVGRL